MGSRGWVWLLLGSVLWSPAAARGRFPKDWKVSVSAHPVSKHGMYDVTVVVRDATRRPIEDAQVQLRLHSTGSRSPRLVALRPVGKGEYRTWVRLNPPHDDPRRLHVWVTPQDTVAR